MLMVFNKVLEWGGTYIPLEEDYKRIHIIMGGSKYYEAKIKFMCELILLL